MISTICSHTMRQKSPKVFGKGPEEHKSQSGHINTSLFPCWGLRSAQYGWSTKSVMCINDCIRTIKSLFQQLLTLSCDVSIAPLVPIHETGINVIRCLQQHTKEKSWVWLLDVTGVGLTGSYHYSFVFSGKVDHDLLAVHI